jgi:gamma-glutamyltranspeptidase
VESRLGPDVLAALEAKGHRVKPAPDLFWRCGQAHGIALRAGTMMGGADPRGDGAALGV